MPRQAITFDFHDTLVHCDPWFQLEIRTLPAAFLIWHERERGGFAPASAGAGFERAYRQLRTAIIEHGHEMSAERSLALIFDRAGLRVSDDDITDGTAALMCAALVDATPVPGALETITTLAEAGVALGVVSSAVYHPFLVWSLERFGMGNYFQTVVTSASCGFYKSRPEIYWRALADLDAEPDRSIHVGDSIRFDVDGAARAGMKTAWLKHKPAAVGKATPNVVFDTLTGSSVTLAALLHSFNQ